MTGTEITVWTISGVLAIGIGASKYSKYRSRQTMVRKFAAMTPEQREKLLSRLQPEMQMQIRQELMERFRVKTDL
jgi:coproporphyrinogen III oxidase-like Fe-S oxidoreductase